MSADRPEQGETFLARWSRVKTESREAAAIPAEPAQAPARADAAAVPPELPSIEKLTLDSDYSGFFHPKVDENLRRSALRKLFSDPHFNVMDGLDVYIDDYSKTEPIPAAMLASLKQAQRILDWAADRNEEEEGASKATEAAADVPALEQETAGADAPAPAMDTRAPDVAENVAQPMDREGGSHSERDA